MCGIAGWFDNKRNLREFKDTTENMINALTPRGPDSKGEYINQNIALLHRRLIVIDPENGTQPMLENTGEETYILIYNGELYNTDDLRNELKIYGIEFKGHSDTEVLLKAYIKWGESILNKLNGIFSFAVWHEKEQKLFLARDPVGVKPLFYYQYSDGIIFSSEIKSILKNPLIKAEIDESGLYELFFMSPGRTCGNGIFKNISELLPGECATYKENVLKKKKYFELTANEHKDDLLQTIETTKYLVKDSIKRQLISDVPLCTFLSGGLDSSIISKVASDYYKEKGYEPLNTYSVNYTNNSKYFVKNNFQPNSDEEYIYLMVNHINSNHHEIILDNLKLAEALPDAVIARDLPLMADVDSSLLLFCKEMKNNFTVGLSGECADELFGGYPWYHDEKILYKETFPWMQSINLRRKILKKGILPKGEEYVHQKYFDIVSKTSYLPDDDKLMRRMREMYRLNYYGFMQNLLDRKDRMSMYSGFEVRVPFCDRRIVEYTYNMPWSIKAVNGREKGILRTAMSDELPYDIVWRKKSPYPKTHNPIYMQTVTRLLKDIISDKSSALHTFIDFDEVDNIIMNPSMDYPWYGQLMRVPQIIAFLVQLDFWFKEYKVEIV